MNDVLCISMQAAPSSTLDCAAKPLTAAQSGEIYWSLDSIPSSSGDPTSSTPSTQLQGRKVTSCSLALLPHRFSSLSILIPAASGCSRRDYHQPAYHRQNHSRRRPRKRQREEEGEEVDGLRHLIAPPTTPGERGRGGERAEARCEKTIQPFTLTSNNDGTVQAVTPRLLFVCLSSHSFGQ